MHSRPWLSALAALLIPAAASAQVTAFVGGRVIDGTGQVVENAVLVVRDGRIASVGPAARVNVPAGATRVDVSGKTIVPGLVNAHGHVAATSGLRSSPEFYTRDNLIRQLRTYADYGITSVYSLGDDQAAGFTLRDEQAAGPLDRARLFVAGTVINGATADEARAATDAAADAHPDVLKIRVDDNLGTSRKMPEPAWRAAIARAHERDLRMAVHIFYLDDARKTVQAGADFVAHSVRDVPVDTAFADLLTSRNVCYCPTLTREISTFVYGSTPEWATDPFFTRSVSADIVSQISDPARQAQVRDSAGYKLGLQYKQGLEVAMRNLKTLSDAGARIAMGTDTGPPGRFQGFFEHLEMEMMADAGLTPMQVLVSATGDATRCHQNTDIGVLAEGKLADLPVLGANPWRTSATCAPSNRSGSADNGSARPGDLALRPPGSAPDPLFSLCAICVICGYCAICGVTATFLPPRLRPASAFFSESEFAAVDAFFAARPALMPTPLVSLPRLAARLGVGELLVKDETARFGLNAFKLLGARFAIEQLASAGRLPEETTLVCASEGNHGRAVAHTALRWASAPACTVRLRVGRTRRSHRGKAPCWCASRQLRRRRARRGGGCGPSRLERDLGHLVGRV
ncbi:MAG: pyridoxal-phosphate dependent enzyme [Vicinamibacterales bacterium]